MRLLRKGATINPWQMQSFKVELEMMDIIWIIWKWCGIILAGGAVVAVLFFALIGVMMFCSYRR